MGKVNHLEHNCTEEKCYRYTPKYYKAIKIRRKHGAIFDNNGDEINEHERGLDEACEVTGKGHCWLLLPKWSETNKQGGKEYIICLECNKHSHL